MNKPAGANVVLKSRAYLTLLACRTCALFAFAFAPVALSFGVLGMPGGSASVLSLILFFQMAPQVVLQLFGGVIADRYPRALLIGTAEFIVGTSWGLLGWQLSLDRPSVPMMCVFAALIGVGGSLVYPALTGIIPDLVDEEYLTEANSYLQGANALARLIGVVAGGTAVALLGGPLALFCATALFWGSSALAFTLPKIQPTGNKQASMVEQLKEGWVEFSSRQWLWVVVVAYAFVTFFFQGIVGVLGPVLANDFYGGATGWTFVLAGEAIGAIVAVVVGMYWRPKHPLYVGSVLAMLAGLPGIGLSFVMPISLVFVLALGLGFGMEIFSIYWMTAMQLEVPAESLSKVASYDAFGSLIFAPLGLIVAGMAADIFGATISTLVASLATILVMALSLLSPVLRSLSPYKGREQVSAQAEVA
ncbi:MAG: MFS transporter [Propionibacteriaceae bacterium]|jgi:hypothetical protein|nr:MFS transporter [Propionibacteriaceae bacterium]